MTNQAGDPICPRCKARILPNTFHVCYDPWSESYFNPSVYNPELEAAIKSMRENSDRWIKAMESAAESMKNISESLQELTKRMKFIEDDLRRK